MTEKKCKGCEFTETIDGKIYCKLAHDFVIDLGSFCPKDFDAEKLKQSCECYLEDGICRASVDEGYADLCRLEKPEDLLLDPDYQAKKEVR